jgi:hypothetical protein
MAIISPFSRTATAPPASAKTAPPPTKQAFIAVPTHTAAAPVGSIGPADATLTPDQQPIFLRPGDASNPTIVAQIVHEAEFLQTVVAGQHVYEAAGAPAQVGLIGTPSDLDDLFQVINPASGQVLLASGIPYDGTVANIRHELIDITQDNVTITAQTVLAFIHSGSGDDTLQVFGSENLINAGGGSNTLIGTPGQIVSRDLMIVDADPNKSVTDLFKQYGAADDIIVRGLTPTDFSLNFADTGDPAHKQLTITATQNANPAVQTALVLPGYTTADVATGGKLQLAFSSDGLGSNFLMVHQPG